MTDAHGQRKVLFICNDVIGERMAGPGIRYWEFARVLSASFAVTLAVPPYIEMSAAPGNPEFPARISVCHSVRDLRALADDADVIVTLGMVLLMYPFLAQTGRPLVVDLYDPFLLSGLHQHADRPMAERVVLHEQYRQAHHLQIRAADFFICASERQRDYWLGMLSAMGRVNPHTHGDDQTLRRLIGVVPFGLPSEPPRHTNPVLKGLHKTIAAGDKVILWGGGIWNWLDAATLVRAMGLISREREDIKLFFLGVGRANTTLPRMKASEEIVALSRELGLYDQYVFFNDWVPYRERQNYLLEADVGVSLHHDHAETRLAFRTRFLDYLWAGLPIVATEGDVMADAVREWQLGRVVAPGDVKGVATALLELVDTPGLKDAYQPRFADAADRYRWEVVTVPLVDFCSDPRLAPDRVYLKEIPGTEARRTSVWSLPGRAWRVFRGHGIRGLTGQTAEYLHWKRTRK